MVQPTADGDPRIVYVKRSRHDWPPNYFQRLIGLRIPFGGESGPVLTGHLTDVRETEDSIELTLWGIVPEADSA